MSESLSVALIGDALRCALKGDEQAWLFLTRPSESLSVWTGWLGIDTRAFCEKMATLQQHGDKGEMLKALRGFRTAEANLRKRARVAA